MGDITAWVLTTGETGMRTQARGLAEAVADRVEEKVIRLRAPWPWLPGAIAAPFALGGLDPGADQLAPPWPDLVVSCGRRSTAASIAVRRASKGHTLAVHVQDPRTNFAAFDLIVAMAHDHVTGPNVFVIDTALHGINTQKLETAGALWRERFARLPHPLIGVLLGGPTKSRYFSRAHAERLLGDLQRVRAASGSGLAITPSRRTPAEVRDFFAERLAGDSGAFVWDMEGDNPYLGILALSDRLVVSSDSVSMISEALAGVAPVEVFDLGDGNNADFLAKLYARKLTRPFAGDVEAVARAEPVNALPDAAAAVRALLARH